MGPDAWCFDYFLSDISTHLLSAVMHMSMDGWDDAEFEPESFVSRDHAGPARLATARTSRGLGFASFEDLCLVNVDLLVPS